MQQEEDKSTRTARKLEAKRLKKQRIEEAGGKRPRKEKAPPAPSQPCSKKHKDNQYSKIKQKNAQLSQQKQQHRFGRVMEHTPCPNQSRMSTLSLAIPGSIVSNAQTKELRTHLVGQIARSAAIYHVDEIVVFNDRLAQEMKSHHRGQYRNRPRDRDRDQSQDGEKKDTNNSHNDDGTKENEKDAKSQDVRRMQPSSDPHAFMARILQYCECPQYLRRHFFPMHPDLQFAGLLAPLDAPHHVRVLDRSEFREGLVVDKKGNGGTGGSLVNCGIRNQYVEIDRVLAPGIRCTVQIDPKAYTTPGKLMKGKVVSPSVPREKDGTYWGYQVRMASSLKAIFDEAPFPDGYDLKIGTSERGDVSVDDENFGRGDNGDKISNFQHAIIVIGGVAGIEECVDADETLNISGNDSKSLFDMWVNVCQYQGSRTIRTEEAVLISLSRLRPLLFSNNAKKETAGKMEQKSATVEFSDDEPSDESSSDGSSGSDEE